MINCMGFADRLFSDADQELMRSLENPTESRQQAGIAAQAGRQAAVDFVGLSQCMPQLPSAWRRLPTQPPASHAHAARRMEDYDSMTHANTLPYEIVDPPRLQYQLMTV
jgi:hypothetical protein